MIFFDSGVGLFDDAVGNFDDGGVVNATATVIAQEVTSTFGTVTATGIQNANQTISGIELTASVGTVTGAGDGLSTANGIEATSAFATITAIGIQNQTQTISGIELSSSVGTVTGAGDGLATPSGIEVTASVSEVLGLGTGSAIVSVADVSLNATTGTVTAVGTSVKKGKKSNAKFLPFSPRPVTIQIDGRAKITTQALESGITPITATGIHNARANVRGVRLKTVCRIPSANGIINPTDEEMQWILGAFEPRQIAMISNVSMSTNGYL